MKKLLAAFALAGAVMTGSAARATPLLADSNDDVNGVHDDRRDKGAEFAYEKNRTGLNYNPENELRLAGSVQGSWASGGLEAFVNIPEDGDKSLKHIPERGFAFDTLAARVRVAGAELDLGKFYSPHGFINDNMAPGSSSLITLDEASRAIALHDQTGADFHQKIQFPGVALHLHGSVFYDVPALSDAVGNTAAPGQGFSPGWTAKGAHGVLGDSSIPSLAGGLDLSVKLPVIDFAGGVSSSRQAQGALNTADQYMTDVHGLANLRLAPGWNILAAVQDIHINGYKGVAGASTDVVTAMAMATDNFGDGNLGFTLHGAAGVTQNTAEGDPVTALEVGGTVRAAWFKVFAALGESYVPGGPRQGFGTEYKMGAAILSR